MSSNTGMSNTMPPTMSSHGQRQRQDLTGQTLGAYMNNREQDRNWMNFGGGGGQPVERPTTASQASA